MPVMNSLTRCAFRWTRYDDMPFGGLDKTPSTKIILIVYFHCQKDASSLKQQKAKTNILIAWVACGFRKDFPTSKAVPFTERSRLVVY